MRDIQKEYGRFGLQWGYGSSPLLHEDALYVQVLHGMHTDDPSYLLRIDKATGKTVWRVERPTQARFESPDAYTTPALLRYGGTTEIVMTGGDVVTGHDPATGRELWRADGLNPSNDGSYRIVASPVCHGDVDLRAVARAADARAQGRRARRRHASRTCCGVPERSRRADAGHRRHVPLFDQRSNRGTSRPTPGPSGPLLSDHWTWVLLTSPRPPALSRAAPRARGVAR